MSDVNAYLSDTPSLVQDYAPLTVTFIPSGFSTTEGAIVRIDYNFGDGSDSVSVKRKMTVDTVEASAYTYQDDLGDPRNINVTHTYYPSITSDPTDYTAVVTVIRSNSFQPIEYEVPVSVLKVNALSGMSEGYFSNIHLIKTRAWGTENNKLLIFETVGPRYVTCMTFSDSINVPPPSGVEITPTPTPTITPTSTPTPSSADPEIMMSINGVPLDETQIPIEGGVSNAPFYVNIPPGTGQINVTIVNTGGGDLNITDINKVHSISDNITFNTNPAPTTVTPSNSAIVLIDYDLPTPGNRYVELNVESDYVFTPYTVTIIIAVTSPD